MSLNKKKLKKINFVDKVVCLAINIINPYSWPNYIDIILYTFLLLSSKNNELIKTNRLVYSYLSKFIPTIGITSLCRLIANFLALIPDHVDVAINLPFRNVEPIS